MYHHRYDFENAFGLGTQESNSASNGATDKYHICYLNVFFLTMFCTCKRSDLLVKDLKLVFLKMEAFRILLTALHNNTIICYKQKFKKLFISYVYLDNSSLQFFFSLPKLIFIFYFLFFRVCLSFYTK